ncbi:hypothetical protein ACMFMG_004929 [Clarireedia jacksonii]
MSLGRHKIQQSVGDYCANISRLMGEQIGCEDGGAMMGNGGYLLGQDGNHPYSGFPLVPDDDDDEEMENAAAEARETMEREMEEHRRYSAYTKSVFRRPQTDQDTVNSTRSLYDSDVVYIQQCGRCYVGDYYMPIDEEELDRLRIIHQIYLQIFDNNLSTVPLHSPTRILDIGTGSGDWAMGMGDLWPDAEIIGTDIAKVQPTAVPLNVFFEIDDAEEEGGWTWPANEFDLVHLRNMAGAFSNWDHIYSEAYEHLKPGGWIEVMDFDDHHAFLTFFAPESCVPRMFEAVDGAAQKSGRPRGVTHLEPEMLTKQGFVDVQVREFGIPMGPWPEDRTLKTIGKLWLVAMLSALEAYALRLLVSELGWAEEEARGLCREFEAELKRVAVDEERARGMQTKMKVLTGRKPGGEEDAHWDGDAGEDADGDSMTTGICTPMVNANENGGD